MQRPVDDLIRIANMGGGMRISAVYGIDALIRIAAAASRGKARVFITNSDALPLDAILRIAGAGDGSVVFE